MFTDQLEREDLDRADPEYVDLLLRVLEIQADCEIGGPQLYLAHILAGAPSKGAQLKIAHIAAEEVDHYRKIALLAAELGKDVSQALRRPNSERYLEAFRNTISDWEDFAAFSCLIDRVGKYQLAEFL